MKYFLDTEFAEHANGIDLISIGIKCQDGSEFYAENSEFDESLANDWVKENVLPLLKSKQEGWLDKAQVSVIKRPDGKVIMNVHANPAIIARMINTFVDDERPEFYAYFADYDWVVLCRTFGRMVDLPERFPKWCVDLKQMMWERGLSKEWKQETCPDPVGEHNALVDAGWNLQLYAKIMEHNIIT